MKNIVRILFPYLRSYRRGLGIGLVVLMIRNFSAAAIPLAIGYSVDQLSAGFQTRLAIEMALLLVGLTALKGLF